MINTIKSILDIKSDIVLGVLLGSIPTIILSIFITYLQYKLQFKKDIALQKQGYFKEILELIQKIETFDYEWSTNYDSVMLPIAPKIEENINNDLNKIKVYIELYFPKVLKNYNKYSEISLKHKKNYKSEKYVIERDIFVNKLRNSIGL